MGSVSVGTSSPREEQVWDESNTWRLVMNWIYRMKGLQYCISFLCQRVMGYIIVLGSLSASDSRAHLNPAASFIRRSSPPAERIYIWIQPPSRSIQQLPETWPCRISKLESCLETHTGKWQKLKCPKQAVLIYAQLFKSLGKDAERHVREKWTPLLMLLRTSNKIGVPRDRFGSSIVSPLRGFVSNRFWKFIYTFHTSAPRLLPWSSNLWRDESNNKCQFPDVYLQGTVARLWTRFQVKHGAPGVFFVNK